MLHYPLDLSSVTSSDCLKDLSSVTSSKDRSSDKAL